MNRYNHHHRRVLSRLRLSPSSEKSSGTTLCRGGAVRSVRGLTCACACWAGVCGGVCTCACVCFCAGAAPPAAGVAGTRSAPPSSPAVGSRGLDEVGVDGAEVDAAVRLWKRIGLGGTLAFRTCFTLLLRRFLPAAAAASCGCGLGVASDALVLVPALVPAPALRGSHLRPMTPNPIPYISIVALSGTAGLLGSCPPSVGVVWYRWRSDSWISWSDSDGSAVNMRPSSAAALAHASSASGFGFAFGVGLGLGLGLGLGSGAGETKRMGGFVVRVGTSVVAMPCGALWTLSFGRDTFTLVVSIVKFRRWPRGLAGPGPPPLCDAAASAYALADSGSAGRLPSVAALRSDAAHARCFSCSCNAPGLDADDGGVFRLPSHPANGLTAENGVAMDTAGDARLVAGDTPSRWRSDGSYEPERECECDGLVNGRLVAGENPFG